MSWLERFRRPAFSDEAHALYVAIVDRARQPVFYSELGVPDTPDGRFDMIVLHAVLLFRRLRRDHTRTDDLAQQVFDLMFADMDQNLREMGLGDIGVAKRVKGMAQGFYGRLAAYDEGLAAGDDEKLAAALRRNLYRKAEPSAAQVAAFVSYMRVQAAALERVEVESLLAGRMQFDSLSRIAER